ncbi:MAG: GlxA family transcriptional regulator [Alphaproteobacteria bacterium]
MSDDPTHVTFVLVPRFNMIALMTFIEPMRVANYLSPEALYSWDYRSAAPGDVTASNGLEVKCGPLEQPDATEPNIVAVCASWGAEHYHNKDLSNWLRHQERHGARLIGVELGVYPLARAGLLAGHIATTHWSWLPGFAEDYPQIDVREQLYTIDRTVMSCAGFTSGLDLMLHLIARQQGEQLASEVANQIMHYPRRPAEGAQRHATGGIDTEVHAEVRAAMVLIEENIEEPLSVPELCEKLDVSQRQLERLFKRDTGCTIVQFYSLLRLQYARVLLTSTHMSIREVSAACGFNSMSYFSQAFYKTFGKMPSAYRQSWPENEPSPSWPGTVYSFNLRSRLQKAQKI